MSVGVNMGDGSVAVLEPELYEVDRSLLEDGPSSEFVVQVFSAGRWAKVRGHEGGPWSTRSRAEKIAAARESAEPDSLSSTVGLPHRVVER